MKLKFLRRSTSHRSVTDLHNLYVRALVEGGAANREWEDNLRHLRAAIDAKRESAYMRLSLSDTDEGLEENLRYLDGLWIDVYTWQPEFPPLHGLVRIADVLPIAMRKAIKALAGDYMHEVQRLHGEGRPLMARWNVLLAWGCAAWYVLRSPFDWTVSLLLRNMRGSSQ